MGVELDDVEQGLMMYYITRYIVPCHYELIVENVLAAQISCVEVATPHPSYGRRHLGRKTIPQPITELVSLCRDLN